MCCARRTRSEAPTQRGGLRVALLVLLHDSDVTPPLSSTPPTPPLAAAAPRCRYFKRFDVPNLKRHGVLLDAGAITMKHAHNTLVISVRTAVHFLLALSGSVAACLGRAAARCCAVAAHERDGAVLALAQYAKPAAIIAEEEAARKARVAKKRGGTGAGGAGAGSEEGDIGCNQQ